MVSFTGDVGAVSELINTISLISSGKHLMPALSGTASEYKVPVMEMSEFGCGMGGLEEYLLLVGKRQVCAAN